MEDFKTTQSDFKYWAFISYSHQDESWASWLHKELERHRLPRGIAGMDFRGEVVPKYLKPVFRDRDELAGASDLGGKLRYALEQSRTLIVICSQKSARSKWVEEEVRYFKSLGRADRVLCLIVYGEPYSGDEVAECFPKAIRFQVGADGQVCDVPAEPLAADVRPGKDGRQNALYKLIAGVLDIGFDRLKRREARRRKIRFLQMSTAVMSGTILTIAGYILLADMGIGVPGKDAIQLALDRREWSVARAPASEEEVSRTARELRERLSIWIHDSLEESGWISQTLREGDAWENSVCSQAQALVALLRMREPRGWDAEKLLVAIQTPFLPKGESDFERRYLNMDESQLTPDSCGVFWSVSLLSNALSRESTVPPANRKMFEDELQRVQGALLPYHKDGGWTIFPGQNQTAPPNSYSTTLALQALLDCKKAGQPWLGSEKTRDELLKSTADWLQGNFDTDYKVPGWTGTGENRYEVFDGLTLQAYAVLLRAQTEAELKIRPEIMEAMEMHLIGCVERTVEFPVASGEFESNVIWFNKETTRKEAYRFLWYPWALEAMEGWLEYAATHPQPHEQVVRMRRARAHLVVNLGPTLVKTMENDWLFIAAETLYGLSSVPDR
jgi:hypothetical protein